MLISFCSKKCSYRGSYYSILRWRNFCAQKRLLILIHFFVQSSTCNLWFNTHVFVGFFLLILKLNTYQRTIFSTNSNNVFKYNFYYGIYTCLFVICVLIFILFRLSAFYCFFFEKFFSTSSKFSPKSVVALAQIDWI